MHIGYFLVAILVGWVYASMTEKPSMGAKVIGPWDMSEIIRHGLCVGGALVGVILLAIFTDQTAQFQDDDEVVVETVFLLSDVMGVTIGAVIGAVLASDVWRVVSGLMGGGGGSSSTGSGM